MSKSVAIHFRDQDIWAFDVVTSVLLKHLVDVALAHATEHGPWLGELIHDWQVQIILADCFGVTLDDAWSDGQRAIVAALFEEACRSLATRSEIPAQEIESWELLNGNRLFARGLQAVGTKPVIRLGHAIAQMLHGSLPAAPPGTWWWYGIEDEPQTVPMANYSS